MGFPWRQLLAGIKIGTGIAATVLPGAGLASSILAMIPGLVETAESVITEPGSGEKKKKLVLHASLVAIAMAEGISQHDLLRNEEAMDAIDALIEATVAFNNAINRVKKEAA